MKGQKDKKRFKHREVIDANELRKKTTQSYIAFR